MTNAAATYSIEDDCTAQFDRLPQAAKQKEKRGDQNKD